MRLKFGLVIAILTVAGSPAAFAQSNCAMPIPPAAPDGRTASPQSIAAAVTDAKNFIAQSDVYQNCLLDYVRTQKEEAAKAMADKDNKVKKPFDPYIETMIQKKIDSNQAAKVRTGAEINTAVNDFKMAHPK